jgi:hypothetical protein
VPAAYASQRLTLHVTEEEQVLIVDRDGMEIARHHLASRHGQRRVVLAHYNDIPFSIQPPRVTGATQLPSPNLAPMAWPDAPVVDTRPLNVYEQIVEERA